MNVIDFMISVERDALRLYELLCKKATTTEQKEMFTVLADSQNKHLSSLESIRNSMNKSELSLLRIKANNPIKKLLNSNDFLQMLKDDQDAFWHVVTSEEEIIKTLEGLASSQSHEHLRRVLDRIVADEKEHLTTIENIYDFMETPYSYLEWGEFSNLRPL